VRIGASAGSTASLTTTNRVCRVRSSSGDMSVSGLPNDVQNAAVPLDSLDRSRVITLADDQHPFQTETSGLSQHLAQRPSGNPTTARRRTDAVADVAIPPGDIIRAVPCRNAIPPSTRLPSTIQRQVPRRSCKGSDCCCSDSTHEANPLGDSTSSDGSSPKPSSWAPEPHSRCASSHC